MLYLALGFIAGVAVCTFLFAVVAAMRVDITVGRVAGLIRQAAVEVNARSPVKLPVPSGFVEIPPDDDEIARQEIIEENRANGRDTRISELQA